MAHRKFVTPHVGTFLHPQLNTHVKNPGDLADQDARNEWESAQQQDTAFRANTTAAEQWLAGPWANWLGEYQSCRLFGPKGQGDPDAPPIAVPFGTVVEVKTAEAGGVFFDIVPGTAENGAAPLCAMPTYEFITAPQHYKTDRRPKA